MFSGISKTILLSILGFGMFLLSGWVSAGVYPEETKLVFYYGPEFKDSVVYNLSDAKSVLKHPKFKRRETHCYIHGYIETQNSESIHVIVESYYKNGNINLLTIDWAVAAAGNYLSASFVNIKLLGPALAEMILDLYNAGLKREQFTVVGHSLGGQLAGITGRQVMKKTFGTVQIYRVAVLDPAYPFFSSLLDTVNKSDAEFVQAIHTDNGQYGQPNSLGTVDFWPNGGERGQPGCPKGFKIPLSKQDFCSHQRSWRFWAESVANVKGPKFWAFPSESYEQFLADGNANLKKKSIEMGINCPVNARGDYYLNTNGKPPFAKGMKFA